MLPHQIFLRERQVTSRPQGRGTPAYLLRCKWLPAYQPGHVGACSVLLRQKEPLEHLSCRRSPAFFEPLLKNRKHPSGWHGQQSPAGTGGALWNPLVLPERLSCLVHGHALRLHLGGIHPVHRRLHVLQLRGSCAQSGEGPVRAVIRSNVAALPHHLLPHTPHHLPHRKPHHLPQPPHSLTRSQLPSK